MKAIIASVFFFSLFAWPISSPAATLSGASTRVTSVDQSTLPTQLYRCALRISEQGELKTEAHGVIIDRPLSDTSIETLGLAAAVSDANNPIYGHVYSYLQDGQPGFILQVLCGNSVIQTRTFHTVNPQEPVDPSIVVDVDGDGSGREVYLGCYSLGALRGS